VAFRCLISLLPVPAVRGAKKPKLSWEAAVDFFYVEFEVTCF